MLFRFWVFPDCTFLDISNITNLIYANVDPKTVQYLAGHENIKETLDIYAKVKYNRPEDIAATINSAFAPKRQDVSP